MSQSDAPTEVDMNFFFFRNSKERKAKTEEERGEIEINFLELTAGLQVQVL